MLSAATVPMAPKIRIIIKIPMNEITNPAMDNPLGDLNTPANEKITPKIHMIQPRIGIHPRNRPISAKTKPAVPMPFEFLS